MFITPVSNPRHTGSGKKDSGKTVEWMRKPSTKRMWVTSLVVARIDLKGKITGCIWSRVRGSPHSIPISLFPCQAAPTSGHPISQTQWIVSWWVSLCLDKSPLVTQALPRACPRGEETDHLSMPGEKCRTFFYHLIILNSDLSCQMIIECLYHY